MSVREPDQSPKPGGDGPVPQPLTLRLHPEADARLVIQGEPASDAPTEFLVSSAVLSVASPYFRVLFGPNFKEGIETRRGDCPAIVLGDDDLEGMETILSLLHFRTLKRFDTLTPEALAAVALQSDKYDCARALRPWVSHWFRGVRGTTDPEKLGFLLVAAYFLRIPDQFLALSARTVRHANASLAATWAKHETISLLPQEIRGAFGPWKYQLHSQQTDTDNPPRCVDHSSIANPRQDPRGTPTRRSRSAAREPRLPNTMSHLSNLRTPPPPRGQEVPVVPRQQHPAGFLLHQPDPRRRVLCSFAPGQPVAVGPPVPGMHHLGAGELVCPRRGRQAAPVQRWEGLRAAEGAGGAVGEGG